jgi:CheY-like chemotaxis protein
MNDVTKILSAIEHGDPQAAANLLPIVYEELRKLAARRMAEEKPGQTLQATALVHEAYLRLVDSNAAKPEARQGRFTADKGSGILVVDDSADTAFGMVRLLRMLGNEAIAAHSGPEAIESARTFRPDFVLLDIGLPGMDGYQVASALRQDEAHKDAVIIAVSGYAQENDRRRSQAAGFDHHLMKPVDFDSLISLMGRPD